MDNNLSDHRAIQIIYNHTENNQFITSKCKVKNKQRMEWQSSNNIKNYSQDVQNKLASCENLLKGLTNTQKKYQIKKIVTELISITNKILIDSSSLYVDSNNKKRKHLHKRKFWWSPTVLQFHREVCNCYKKLKNVIDNQVSATTEEIEILRKNLRIAKQIFRKNKRFAEKLKKDLGLQRLNSYFNYSKDMFWSKVNMLKKNQKSLYISLPILKEHYSKLFNTTNNLDTQETERIKKNVDGFLKTHNKKIFDLEITTKILRETISELHNGKSIGIKKLSNEHLKYCESDRLDEILAKCYSTMFNYSFVPDDFNISVIKPIIKDTSQPADAITNQRPIAISDVYSNLLEKIILKQVENTNKSPEEQFGFKKNCSCEHPVMIINEAIKLTKKRERNFYIVAIDASKAFDHVERNRLYQKLINSNVSIPVILLIIAYYNVHFIMIENGEERSELFRATNSVKQGGSLSPWLYSMYSADLLKGANDSKLGILFYKKIVSSVGFADDLMLLADSLIHAQKLIDITSKQAIKDDIEFNPLKSAILSNDRSKPAINLNGVPMKYEIAMRYLGVQLDIDGNGIAHLEQRIKKSNSSLALLRSLDLFSNQLRPYTKAFLYKVYIRPLIYYGVGVFQINAELINRIQYAESMAIKSMMGIHKRSHNTHLLAALKIESTKSALIRNKINLLLRLTENPILSQLLEESNQVNEESSFINETMETIDSESTQLLEIAIILCRRKLSDLQSRHESLQNLTKTKEIEKILQISNRSEFSLKIWEAIGFANRVETSTRQSAVA